MKLLPSLALILTSASAALAGTEAPSMAAPMATAKDDLGITGSASLGYDSAYYFRGLWFSNNNLWGGVNLSMPVAEKLTFGVGALYTETFDTHVSGSGDLDYSELDLIASLNYDAGFAKFGLVYTNYRFFDTFSGSIGGNTVGNAANSDATLSTAHDIGVTAVVPFGNANFYAGVFYDITIAASYAELGADYTFAVSDMIKIVPSVQLGYAQGYYTFDNLYGVENGFTHVRVGVSAPIAVSSSFTVTPYIAGNFSLDAREKINTVEGKNDLFGGVSVSVAF